MSQTLCTIFIIILTYVKIILFRLVITNIEIRALNVVSLIVLGELIMKYNV